MALDEQAEQERKLREIQRKKIQALKALDSKKEKEKTRDSSPPAEKIVSECFYQSSTILPTGYSIVMTHTPLKFETSCKKLI